MRKDQPHIQQAPQEQQLALYRIGVALNSEFMGVLLTRFILDCWGQQKIPVINCKGIKVVKGGRLVKGCLSELKTRQKKPKTRYIMETKITYATENVKKALSHIAILCKQFILYHTRKKKETAPL
ncbi:hypothetical protein [Thermovirga lienii]|uniref:hypothetical protein n=1 Tax=Thermovirga lienii TaxID=336261 RepID=UPI002FE16496